MDRRKDIQEFLTSRRARLTPDQAGLASFGDRCRVPGLRWEEVALLVPAVNQIEVDPYFAQRDVQALNAEHGILSQAWSPIAFYAGWPRAMSAIQVAKAAFAD